VLAAGTGGLARAVPPRATTRLQAPPRPAQPGRALGPTRHGRQSAVAEFPAQKPSDFRGV